MAADAGHLFEEIERTPGLDAALVTRLRDWIMSAPEPELYRINLAGLAPRWRLPLKTAITHFLHLNKAGVVDLSWDMHCPQCNVVLDRQESLRMTGPIHYCKFCLQDVESRLDDHFEVTFTPNPRVRNVGGYVHYEPSSNVEVYLKEKIAAGAEARTRVTIPAGAMRLRFVSWPPVQVKVIPTARRGTDAAVRFEGDDSVQVPDSLPAGESMLVINNDTPGAVNLMIENHDMREYRPDERAPRLTGFDVVSTPAFRALFGSETLSDRESLKVRDATLVFTDIKGSTSLYQRVGDVRAYTLVRDHFDTLFDSVLQHEGIVIKTIGDSVMASFQSPGRAVDAMLDAQRRFSHMAGGGGDSAVRIRAGIHRGPVIAVTLNGRLDYFGSAVNEAARIEGVCDAGEIVISEAVMLEPGVRDRLNGRSVTPFQSELKGLEHAFNLYRVSQP